MVYYLALMLHFILLLVQKLSSASQAENSNTKDVGTTKQIRRNKQSWAHNQGEFQSQRRDELLETLKEVTPENFTRRDAQKIASELIGIYNIKKHYFLRIMNYIMCLRSSFRKQYASKPDAIDELTERLFTSFESICANFDKQNYQFIIDFEKEQNKTTVKYCKKNCY